MMRNTKINSLTSTLARSLWSSLAILAFATGAHAQFYAVTDLGTLGGSNAVAYSINNREQIVGAAQTGMGNYHAWMFEGGRMMDLGTLGGSNSWCYGVNDNGWAVGTADLLTNNRHAFLCTNALTNPVMTDLGTLGGSDSAAWMINMHGEMAGWAAMTNGSHHAFFMTNGLLGSMMDLGAAGGTNSEAYCLNSNRMVVGYAMMSDGSTKPIMSTNAIFGSSTMMQMGMGGMGASGGMSRFINDLGQTTGEAWMPGGNHHAFVSGGTMMGMMNVDLGTLGGSNSTSYCINNAGDVVGTTQVSNGAYHAFMVTNAMGGLVRMMDLNALIPNGSEWELMEARSINASGQIAGWGMHAGHTNAFLMTPTSTPVMMLASPPSQVVGPGAMVSLRMQMSAGEPLSYQWLHGGAAIPDATNSTLTLPGMNMGSAGQYTVTARNAAGTVASSSAAICVFTMELTNGSPYLTLAAPAGRHFSVEYSDALNAGGSWQTMTNFTMMSSMSGMMVPPPTGSHARFYRAVLIP